MRPSTLLLALALFAGAAVAGPGADLGKRLRSNDPKERSAAIREIKADPDLKKLRLAIHLLADEDTYVRDITWSLFARLKRPDWIRWAADAAKSDRRALLRHQAADAFGRGLALAAVPVLAKMLEDRDRTVRLEAANALGRFRGSEEAWKAVDGRKADRDPALRAACLESMGRIDKRGAVPALMTGLRDEEPGVRCVALRSLRYGDREVAIEAGAWALSEGEWRLRAQAIENALWLRDRRVVEGLVGALRRTTSARIRADLFDALRRLTGLEIPPDVGDWEAWWKRHGDAWTKGGRIPKKVDEPAASGVARYYGIPVRSERMIFILDASGSMRQTMGEDDDRRKMDVAKDELLRVLEKLGPRYRFNVIVFADDVRAFRDGLVPADANQRRRLATFLRPCDGEGRTNLYDALELALEDDEADTVFLLSDGAPSRGKYQFRERVREHVRRLNRMKKMAIHTIAFGGRDVDRGFLKDLAEANTGVFVVSRGP
jgi:HEAT repeat protein